MNCPDCKDTRLKVSHVYNAGPLGRTRRLSCKSCGETFVSVELLERSDSKNGAYARAQRLRSEIGRAHV